MKRPRQYAKEICDEPDIEKRRALLERVPDVLRPITETHVRNWFQLAKFSKENAK